MPNCRSWAFHEHTCSVRCVTCASSSFSPLAGVDGTGIFLADEGLDVGVEDLGVVELDLDAPMTDKGFITQRWMTDNVIVTQLFFLGKHKSSLCSKLGSYEIIITGVYDEKINVLKSLKGWVNYLENVLQFL